MCTIATAKVQINYNCYNVYFYECLRKALGRRNPNNERRTIGYKKVGHLLDALPY